MKQYMKSIIALAALLLTTSASAQETAEKFAITYQLDGQESSAAAAGTVVGSISGSTAMLTVTPAEGNYITKDQITVIKTTLGDNAQTRTSVSSPVEITASSTTADPSGETTYTFDASDANFNYEVTANFLSRKDVAEALILLPEDAYFEYQGGEAIEPAISVTYAGEALTADKDFTVAYSNNKNAGLGVITITGIGMYKGTKSVNFDIHQASVAIWFETAAGGEAKELETVFGTTFTEPVLKLDPAGVIEVIYSVNDESVATINPSTGKLTILKTGTVEVTAAAAKDYANEEGSNYNVTPENTTKSYTLTINPGTVTLTFSKQELSATLGAEFEAPTLTVSPEGITPIEYESMNTEAAAVDKNTGVVTLVGEGETTIKAIFPGNENYEYAETFYMLKVNKAKATLAYSAQTATAVMGQAFTAPTLNNPNNLAVTYSSSKETVATISTEGIVALVGVGETTIKATFAGNDTYKPAEASYTLTVEKSVGIGYPLWIGDTQVTEENAEDILGHKIDSSKPYYIYNKDKKQLYMDNDQTRTTVIESRMPELTVYIKDANKIKRIFFNNTGDASNKGNLTFTTNGNFPGKLIIANPTKGESAIKGFSNISYNWDLTAIEPDGSYYDTTTLEMKYKNEMEATVIADTITIGEAIVPITEKRAITFEESQLVEKDEDGKVKKDESGNPIKANLSNYSYAPSSTTGEPEKNVIHISLNSANIGDDAGGFDIENGVGGIYIEDTMTDEKAGQVAQDVNDNKMVPGGTLYAESYDGFTFKLIAGSGTIEIDEIVENDHEFHLIIGTGKPITLNGNNSIIRPYDGKSVRVQAEIAFNVGAPTYCFLYMVKKTAGTRGTRLGKRDKAHGKLVSVQVRSTTVIPTEPPSEATGGVIPKSDDPEPETDPTPPTGIREVKSDKMAVKSGWYTIDGQKIAEPTQRGLYIKDGRKVVIK